MSVSPTSVINYHNEIKGKKENSQDSLILSAFVAIGKPATVRMIQRYLRGINIEMETSSIARSTNNLHTAENPKIVFFNAEKCDVTGRTANYYESILKLKQGELF